MTPVVTHTLKGQASGLRCKQSMVLHIKQLHQATRYAWLKYVP